MTEVSDVAPAMLLPESGPSIPAGKLRSSGLAEVVSRHLAVKAARQAPEKVVTTGRGGNEENAGGVQPRSVVVIDDELDLVDLTVMLLQARGHHVVGSTDGSEAVALVDAEDADVVVLDFMLAGMTGGDVCLALRAQPKTRATRVVLLSGTTEREIRQTCTQYDAYLRKPVASWALYRAVECV